MDINNVESLSEKFYAIINKGLKLFVPLVNNSWKKKSSWKIPLSSEVRNLIKCKHRLWAKFQRNKDSQTLSEYKRIRNLVRKNTRAVVCAKQLDIAKKL